MRELPPEIAAERPTIGYTQPPPRPRDVTLAVSDPNPDKKIRIIGDVPFSVA